VDSVENPAYGAGVNMRCVGRFGREDDPNGTEYDNLVDIHSEKGALLKTSVNRAVIVCDNAGNLFSAGMGSVSVRLSLPYAIANGVYQPLAGGTDRTLTDLVIWGANFGDTYITQPGLYAALTPAGIEFTVWTSSGKHSILDVTSNAEANRDVVLEFVWDHLGRAYAGSTMALYVNGTLSAYGSGHLLDEALDGLYTADGSPVNANFCVMDSPSRKNSLNGVIRRLETHRRMGSLPSGATGRQIRAPAMSRGFSTLDFTFIGSEGSQVVIPEPEFDIVIPKEVNLHSVGPTGASRHVYGRDSGEVSEPQSLPIVPEDLPLGFEEIELP